MSQNSNEQLMKKVDALAETIGKDMEGVGEALGGWETNKPGIVSRIEALEATAEVSRTIDGVSFDGTSDITHYGTCSTEADTADKTVDIGGFTLASGAEVTVRFTVTNTAESPTLNINSTGAKAIQYRTAAISAGILAAGRTYRFVYDGTYWQLVGDIDTNTTSYLPLEGGTMTGGITWDNHENALVGNGDNLTWGGKKVVVTGSSGADAVIYVIETWRNGASWYRKWSDGWIEQGNTFTATLNYLDYVITFPIAFSDTNYFAVHVNNSTARQDYCFDYVHSKTTTNCKLVILKGTTMWYACGY